MANEDQDGVLLIGHGTRHEIGIAQFWELAHVLAERLAPRPVEAAFLELQRPDITQAVSALLARGVRRVVAAPLLLFAAGHAKRDIPVAIQDALQRLGAEGVTVSQAEHLGLFPAVLELSHLRWQQALGGRTPLPADQCCLLLVGRGSSDESATAEMHELARLRQIDTGGARTEVAFVAMARPALCDQLQRLAVDGIRRVIVQPHLLFEGEIADTIRDHVRKMAAERSSQEWLLAPLLADLPGQNGAATKLLTESMCDRIDFACQAENRIR